MGKLDGKVAVVTGAGSGIGAATAAVMASHGASVACADLDLARAEATAKGIRDGGSHAIAVELDVTKPESNDAAAKAVVDELGGLHVAHLNAGVASMGSVLEIALEEWDRTMAVNLRGVFLGLQSFGRAIASSGGGSIVITSSGAGLMGGRMMGTYCATKFAVIGLMKTRPRTSHRSGSGSTPCAPVSSTRRSWVPRTGTTRSSTCSAPGIRSVGSAGRPKSVSWSRSSRVTKPASSPVGRIRSTAGSRLRSRGAGQDRPRGTEGDQRATMNVTILDDYLDTLRTLACFRELDGHDVTIWTDHIDDLDELVERLARHRGPRPDPRAHDDPAARCSNASPTSG